MRRPSIFVLALLAACGHDKSPSTPTDAVATPATSAVVDPAPSAAGDTPQRGTTDDPTADHARPVAPKPIDGLTLTLEGPRRYRARHFDASTLAAIDALSHPATATWVPGGTRLQAALLGQLSARTAHHGPSVPSAADRHVIASWLPKLSAQQKAEHEAEARYRARFGDTPRALHVAPAEVDLTLRLHNGASHTMHVKLNGDWTSTRLSLTGPGARHMLGGGDKTEILMCGQWASVAAGEHLDVPVDALRYGDRATELGAVWTEPGRYTLTMSLDTVIAKGAAPNPCDGGKRVELTTPSIPIDVH